MKKNNEIISQNFNEENGSDYETLQCVLSKENVDFIRRQAEYNGLDKSRVADCLISAKGVDNPELAAILSIMQIDYIIKDQSSEDKSRAVSVIAGELINKIIRFNQCTLDEAVNEAVKNLNEAKRIVEDMKKTDD